LLLITNKASVKPRHVREPAFKTKYYPACASNISITKSYGATKLLFPLTNGSLAPGTSILQKIIFCRVFTWPENAGKQIYSTLRPCLTGLYYPPTQLFW